MIINFVGLLLILAKDQQMALILKLEPSSSIPTPDVGKLTLYADSGSNSLQVVRSDGTILPFPMSVSGTNLGGTTGIGVYSGSNNANGSIVLNFYSLTGSGAISVSQSGSVVVISAAVGTTTAQEIQNQTYVGFTTTGTPPNFIITPSPALTSYQVLQRFQIMFHSASITGSLNVNGLGAKTIKTRNNLCCLKRNAHIRLSQSCDVYYDGTDFVIL